MSLVYQDGKAPGPVFVADLVEDKWKLLHRADDDLLAALDKLAQIAGVLRVPNVAPTCANCLMVAWIWSSRMRRSVTTIIESNAGWPSLRRPMSWWASHAMEFDFPLPAECWIKYRLPAPFQATSASRRRTTSS